MILHDHFPNDLSGSDLLVGDCAALIKDITVDLIDLTVTSPPYDNLRTYNGYTFDFETVAQQLYRVTKPGGVVVWVVGDQTVDGSETGTSLRQALYFKACGFNLHDTMIYEKQNPVPCEHNRYQPCWEYMFVFSKGKPRCFQPIMVPATYQRLRLDRKYTYPDGTRRAAHTPVVRSTKYHSNIFDYGTFEHSEHPAIFPEALAVDCIKSWSNPGDIVFDPFSGSGTTAKMAKAGNRKFLGCEISREYAEQSKRRVDRQDTPLNFECEGAE